MGPLAATSSRQVCRPDASESSRLCMLPTGISMSQLRTAEGQQTFGAWKLLQPQALCTTKHLVKHGCSSDAGMQQSATLATTCDEPSALDCFPASQARAGLTSTLMPSAHARLHPICPACRRAWCLRAHPVTSCPLGSCSCWPFSPYMQQSRHCSTALSCTCVRL